MGHGLIVGQGNLIYSDDCTATKNDIIKGKTALFKGSDDEIGVGALELTGNAVENQVLAGRTFYADDAHVKKTGNIQSLAGWSPIPSTQQQILESKGKYMTGDVVIPPFLLPPAEVIKAGATVSIYDHSVTGTWEGYTPITDYLWNAGNVGGVIGTGRLGFGSLGQVYSDDDNTSGNTLTSPQMMNLRRYNRIFVEMGRSSPFSHASVDIYVIHADGSQKLLHSFYTTSVNYVMLYYDYDASWWGKLKLVFTQRGTGIRQWGIQNI